MPVITEEEEENESFNETGKKKFCQINGKQVMLVDHQGLEPWRVWWLAVCSGDAFIFGPLENFSINHAVNTDI